MSGDMHEIEIVVRSPERPKPTTHDPERTEREPLGQLRVTTSESLAWDVFQEATTLSPPSPIHACVTGEE